MGDTAMPSGDSTPFVSTLRSYTRDQIAAYLATKTKGTLWGQEEDISPRLITEKYREGGAWLAIAPTSQRPNFYVIEVPRILIDGDDDEIYDALDDLYELVEDEFGSEDGFLTNLQQICEDEGREPTEEEEEECWKWPVPDWSGSNWWEFCIPTAFLEVASDASRSA